VTPKTGCGCRTAGEKPGGGADLASGLGTLAVAAALARRRRRQT
jgi:MYXO-CTERM domain-containing protein